jgi:hypothetical protein
MPWWTRQGQRTVWRSQFSRPSTCSQGWNSGCQFGSKPLYPQRHPHCFISMGQFFIATFILEEGDLSPVVDALSMSPWCTFWWLAPVLLWVLESENGPHVWAYYPTQSQSRSPPPQPPCPFPQDRCQWALHSSLYSTTAALGITLQEDRLGSGAVVRGFLYYSYYFIFTPEQLRPRSCKNENFQQITLCLLSLWGGEFLSVWIIADLTCQGDSVSALLMI